MIGVNEIRERFLAFFEGKKHLRMQSFPLIPHNDKSLLIINSGMAPLKPYFTGAQTPPSKRVTTCQKCIRTGDIENVGVTSRHITFFEMLGNFSFGDYFKHEVIPWAWEFVTEAMGISPDRLYISVYQEDDEAFEIWNKSVGISADRIYRLGKDDNFWEVGLGPCGPCSEIYFDRGEKYGCGKPGCAVGCDCDRFIEIWNLVFTQFNKNEDGTYSELAQKNIDTGMGLERMAVVMQDVETVTDIDTFKLLRNKVKSLRKQTESNEKTERSERIISDHIRSVTFMAADGIIPSNEGRGYVLRRLLRRAARHGKLIGIDEPFLSELCRTVVEMSKDAYPELIEKSDYIYKILSVEENRFYETLDTGLSVLREAIAGLNAEKSAKILDGETAFKLYDTFGFPLELMEEIIAEHGMSVDKDGFDVCMQRQRQRARDAREETNYMGAEKTVFDELPADIQTEFLGYNSNAIENAKILAIIAGGQIADKAEATESETEKIGEMAYIVLDKTVCYAESGGQKGDKGTIKTANGVFTVLDCIKTPLGKVVHAGKVENGSLKVGEKASVEIDMALRMDAARNHSATHLLQKALREVAGTHIEQAGSYVTADRLRFDFTHFTALTPEELQRIEDRVNEQIMAGLAVNISEQSIEEARKKGAMALFGEKYGDSVRVVDMGAYSIELCGGTHVRNTMEIGLFKLLSENSVAAGVRRIEGLTGRKALAYFKETEGKLKSVTAMLKATPDNLITKVQGLLDDNRQLSKQIEKMNAQKAGSAVDEMLKRAEDLNGFEYVSEKLAGMDMNGLRTIADRIKEKLKKPVLILCGVSEDKVNFLAYVCDEAVKAGIDAGKMVKAATAVTGGGGGGKPNSAQAGGKDATKADEALKAVKRMLFSDK